METLLNSFANREQYLRIIIIALLNLRNGESALGRNRVTQ